jgi:glycosyltransferase involved in cell wall biosynthesis
LSPAARGSSAGRRRDDGRPRIAYLSFSTGEYDARSFRMARSAIDAGYEVTVYSRWHAGQPPVEEHDGFRLIRAPFSWRLAVPILRGPARRRIRREMAAAARAHDARTRDGGDDARMHARSVASTSLDVVPAGDGSGHGAEGDVPAGGDAMPPARAAGRAASPPARRRSPPERVVRCPFRVARRIQRQAVRTVKQWRHVLQVFPLRPMAWARSLDEYAEAADVWHGMWAGSLPALERMRARHGGRTIYDSRDVYMLSREFSRLGWPLRPALAGLERRWAQSADRVLTVNDSYADLLVGGLRVPRPPVVMNCAEIWIPSDPPPDLIRDATGIPAATPIALYQGQLMSERGIEQTMDAILEVPDAVLVLLGFGDWAQRFRAQSEAPPYRGRVIVMPAVTPAELIDWTASSDVMVMAIQPTTVNHRFTTPQKLFEAIAAGVPVVASDLPGMATIVRESGVGELCDPTSPESIAAAIRRIIDRPPDARAALRAHVLEVARARYNWDAQLSTLFGLYGELAPPPVPRGEIAAEATSAS